MKPIYYLFGERACAIYEEFQDDTVAQILEHGDYQLSVFKEGDHPSTILSEFNGWQAFSEIDEETYNELLKHLQ
ncbi:MAG TPA: hypothetical protein PLE71_17290 [Flavobacteriales bacterium]|nr:hypothetical protein [Flavobacteriales bacterium]